MKRWKLGLAITTGCLLWTHESAQAAATATYEPATGNVSATATLPPVSQPPVESARRGDVGHGIELAMEAFITPEGETGTAGLEYQLFILDHRLKLDGKALDLPRHLSIDHQLTYLRPGVGAVVPDDLVDHSLTASFDIGNVSLPRLGAVALVGKLGAGYAGNANYGDGDGWYGIARLSGRAELTDKTSLILGLSYDGHRAILPDVPLPTIVWEHRVSPSLTYGVGFPGTYIRWSPDDAWTLTVDYWLPMALNVEAAYRLRPGLSLIGSYKNRSETFTLDSNVNHDRLFFEMQRLELGVRWTPSRWVEVEIAGGYAFDQSFSTGYNAWDSHGAISLDSQPFLRAGVKFEF